MQSWNPVYLHSITNQSGNPRVSALPLNQSLGFFNEQRLYTYIVFLGISPFTERKGQWRECEFASLSGARRKNSRNRQEAQPRLRSLRNTVSLGKSKSLGRVELNLERYPYPRFAVPRPPDIISRAASNYSLILYSTTMPTELEEVSMSHLLTPLLPHSMLLTSYSS